jgi:hypothetical protein
MMTIEEMANSLVEQWPTPLSYDDAALVVDAMLSTHSILSEADVHSVTVVETDLGGIDIQLAIDEDKMPKVIT